MTPAVSPSALAEAVSVLPGAFRLDHVAVAVADLQAALALYRDTFGLPVSRVEHVADQKVDVAFVGEEPGRIELVCPSTPESSVAKFIERKGEGLHHVAVRVHDLDGTLARLKERGVQLIDAAGRPGAHGTRVAFVHPKGARGVLLELVQLPAGEGH